MKKTTREKLEYLQKYVNRNFTKWRVIYGEELTGVHVGLKRRNGRRLRYYTIVFHVLKKRDSPEKLIPKSIKIKFRDRNSRDIPTDVIETGKLELNGVKLGDRIKNTNSSKFGSIGIFLKNGTDVYACSNMHVLAPGLIDEGQFRYPDTKIGQNDVKIKLYNQNIAIDACLEMAIYGGIDAGVARISNPHFIDNFFKDTNIVPIGFMKINYENYKDIPVWMVGASSGKQKGFIRNVGIIKIKDNVVFSDLLQVDIYTQKGDSGSAMLDDNNQVIGILFARENAHSYFFPITKIVEYFKMQLLTN
ncbi:MAG: hypothetical protein IAE90_15450 [Ignavibacteria bacterium]|nr:hypothetical protein [Ignavibacteria bacterium]